MAGKEKEKEKEIGKKLNFIVFQQPIVGFC